MMAVPYLLAGLVAKMKIGSPRAWLIGYPLLFAVVAVLSRIPIANISTPHGCEYGVDVSQYFWFERVAFAPLGMLQDQFGNFHVDSLGRPVECADWIAIGYGLVIYWLAFRVMAKLKMNFDVNESSIQPARTQFAISD